MRRFRERKSIRLGSKRALWYRLFWDWGMFGLGGYISFDDDNDDWGWVLQIHFLFLYAVVSYSRNKIDKRLNIDEVYRVMLEGT